MSTVKGLTGGSGDVNPQIYRGTVTESAANTWTVESFPLPITRIPGATSNVTIVELLWVEFKFRSNEGTNGAAEALKGLAAYLMTSNSVTAPNFADPQVVCARDNYHMGAFTAGGSYSRNVERQKVCDMTDRAGHGILVATENIFVGVGGAGNVVAGAVDFHLCYRFKRVNLANYIGIVQSQQ